MMPPRELVLFVPASSVKGSGEYSRCLTLAQALVDARVVTASSIRFLLNKAAGYADQCPFATTLLPDTPTRCNAEVIRIIRSIQPKIVVFDSGGRSRQAAAAQAAGARTVFISSRPKRRRRGYRLRWLRHLDEHWHVQARFIDGAETPVERLRRRFTFNRTRVRFLDALFSEPSSDLKARVLRELKLKPGRYVLFSPGGGGSPARLEGLSPPEVFVEVARRVRVPDTWKCIVVMGPNYPGVISVRDDGHVLVRRAFPVREFTALAQHAGLAVISGGSLISQMILSRRPTVSVSLGSEQLHRLDRALASGAIVAADFSIADIVQRAQALLDDESARVKMSRCASEAGLANGVREAVAVMGQWLGRAPAWTTDDQGIFAHINRPTRLRDMRS